MNVAATTATSLLKQELRKSFLQMEPEFNREAPKLMAVCHRLIDSLADHAEDLPSYAGVIHDLEVLENSLEHLQVENSGYSQMKARQRRLPSPLTYTS